MKITAKIEIRCPELVKPLQEMNYKCIVTPNATLVTINRSIPPLLDAYEYTLYIEAEELGGSWGHDIGHAQIACSIQGNPLRPYYIRTTGNIINGTHGKFSVQNCIVTTKGHGADPNVMVEKWGIREFHNTVDITCDKMHYGTVTDMENIRGLEKFVPAAEACLKKANCFHCQGLHYVMGVEDDYLCNLCN